MLSFSSKHEKHIHQILKRNLERTLALPEYQQGASGVYVLTCPTTHSPLAQELAPPALALAALLPTRHPIGWRFIPERERPHKHKFTFCKKERNPSGLMEAASRPSTSIT